MFLKACTKIKAPHPPRWIDLIDHRKETRTERVFL